MNLQRQRQQSPIKAPASQNPSTHFNLKLLMVQKSVWNFSCGYPFVQAELVKNMSILH